MGLHGVHHRLLHGFVHPAQGIEALGVGADVGHLAILRAGELPTGALTASTGCTIQTLLMSRTTLEVADPAEPSTYAAVTSGVPL